MSSSRQRLPNRRSHWLFQFEAGGQTYTGGVGRFTDGTIAEVFLNGCKAGSAADANAQDAAIVASLALQNGCPVRTLSHALRRNNGSDGALVILLTLAEAARANDH